MGLLAEEKSDSTIGPAPLRTAPNINMNTPANISRCALALLAKIGLVSLVRSIWCLISHLGIDALYATIMFELSLFGKGRRNFVIGTYLPPHCSSSLEKKFSISSLGA